MKLLRLLPIILLFGDSCVEPYDLTGNEFVKSLVVDGMITDKPGPYILSLRYSTPAASDLDEAPRATGAIVTLHDDQGNSSQYTEVVPGYYFSPANGIRGVVGRSYHITIRLKEKEYISRPSKLMPSGSITDLYARFEETAVNFDDPTLPQDAIRVYFSSTGVPGESNLYRWRWSGTYELQTLPGLRVKRLPRGSQPDPVRCSGLVYTGGQLKVVGPCECCVCYMDEYSQTIQVSKSSVFQSAEYKDVLLATLPYESKRFFFKYRIKAEQLSLDQEAYDYWRLVAAQQEGSTDIFQPTNIKIQGNVTCTSDPDERVLGIFYASSVADTSMVMPRTLNQKLLDPDTAYEDCRLYYKGSTNVKPENW